MSITPEKRLARTYVAAPARAYGTTEDSALASANQRANAQKLSQTSGVVEKCRTFGATDTGTLTARKIAAHPSEML